MIRRANKSDQAVVLKLYEEAINFMNSYGSPQWQNGTGPNEKTFDSDLRNNALYVNEINGEIVAVASMFKNEPTYQNIKGKWLSELNYIVMHRIVKKLERRGKRDIEDFFIYIKEELKMPSIRIDTHQKNIPMQKLLKRNNFTYCGEITLEQKSDAKRDAYQLDFK